MDMLTLAQALPGETALAAFGLTAALLVAAAAVVFVVAAVISIIASRTDGGMKLVWLVLVVVAPFIGSALWFLVGRRRVPA
ncbi:PLDc N-terminal domain-containing protein [Nocardiopsis changdeensis]|uniref:PLDc N-terminal domain-containing protein n=1 Tax=Nocardiopsis changdeensis TaxID=2831969 RepID=A0ABX8BK05_9ACTN|nr:MULTISPECIES: PLDc N-terminal domain-containing protein [Nocardiopsis]QUX22436.1 PLDc N-terminal domain-containing protein [Nocardiopsis changdeensis]QYX38378.1 PLDc N-terminal domain-containing protein [Nocardiopsis sp. MT53]